MTFRFAFPALFLLAALPAADPVINYQGRLEESGVAVNETRNLQCSILSGTAAIWTGPVTPVTITDGLYATPLILTGLTPAQLASANLKLRVKIANAGGTMVTLTPDVTLLPSLAAYSVVAGGVTSPAIAANAVTSAKILDGTIAAADLANGAATTAKIADRAVTSAKIADATIVAADLANGAVTSAKIADGAVTTADLANGSITTAKLAAGVDLAVLSASVAALTQRLNKLDGQVTMADLVGTYRITLFGIRQEPNSNVLLSYTLTGTIALASNGTYTYNLGTRTGYGTTSGASGLVNATYSSGPVAASGSWTFNSGVVTLDGRAYDVVAGGRMLVGTSAYAPDGANEVIHATRIP
ncbi:MAG: hypothetical protein RLZZ127_845 [Planctomycetota bacterium]|jgi:hypothetical protein